MLDTFVKQNKKKTLLSFSHVLTHLKKIISCLFGCTRTAIQWIGGWVHSPLDVTNILFFYHCVHTKWLNINYFGSLMFVQWINDITEFHRKQHFRLFHCWVNALWFFHLGYFEMQTITFLDGSSKCNSSVCEDKKKYNCFSLSYQVHSCTSVKCLIEIWMRNIAQQNFGCL